MASSTSTRSLCAIAFLAGAAVLVGPRAGAQTPTTLINRSLQAESQPSHHESASSFQSSPSQLSPQDMPMLQQAAYLAGSGQYAQAMEIYQRILGANPPAGDVALAYCETSAATPEGRTHAIATLRSLAEQFPSDARYPIAVGRILAYMPETRAQGRALLSQYAANDSEAAEALSQAILWDSTKTQPAIPSAEYQRQQIARLADRAQQVLAQQIAQTYGPYVPLNAPAATGPQSIAIQSAPVAAAAKTALDTAAPKPVAQESVNIPNASNDAYGPYVPYTPPVKTETAIAIAALHAPTSALENASWGYTPTPSSVRLGNASPRTGTAQKDVTDVLPTARYASSPRIGSERAVRLGNKGPLADHPTDTPLHNATYDTPSHQPEFSGTYGQQYPRPEFDRHQAEARRRAAPTHKTSKPKSAPHVTSVKDHITPFPVPMPLPAPAAAPDANLVAKALPPPTSADSNAMLSGIIPPIPPQRDKEKEDLARRAEENTYSGWFGGAGYARYRGGDSGIDRLIDREAPFEVSGMLGRSLRATIIPRTVLLSSGALDNASFQHSASAGNTVPIIGTLPGNALRAPVQQYSSGTGGELQLNTRDMGAAVGYTPYEFLVSNITARFRFRPARGPFTFYAERDSVRDTQLSYAGLRDPGTITPLYSGKIWGGVMSTGGGVRVEFANDRASIYTQGGWADVSGYHVLRNRRLDASIGATFLMHRWPGTGKLAAGLSLAGMHYDNNERGMTYGQGGYFSPHMYFAAAVPVTYEGNIRRNFNFRSTAGLGLLTFNEQSAPYYPLDIPLQTGSHNAFYPEHGATRLNYLSDTEGVYRASEHWYFGAFVMANNSSYYNVVAGGFFVRYVFKPQIVTESAPRGFFDPLPGFRPMRVP